MWRMAQDVKTLLKGRAFGQFSSSKSQRPDSTDPVEIKLTDQEDECCNSRLV